MFIGSHARIWREGAGGPDPLENHKAIGFFSQIGLDPFENHKATQPALSVVVQSSARQRNDIKMAFRWWAKEWYLDPLSPHQPKKAVRVGTPLTKLYGSAHGIHKK